MNTLGSTNSSSQLTFKAYPSRYPNLRRPNCNLWKKWKTNSKNHNLQYGNCLHYFIKRKESLKLYRSKMASLSNTIKKSKINLSKYDPAKLHSKFIWITNSRYWNPQRMMRTWEWVKKTKSFAKNMRRSLGTASTCKI